jgi:branched-chain amino acid transport system substrate-binding protein
MEPYQRLWGEEIVGAIAATRATCLLRVHRGYGKSAGIVYTAYLGRGLPIGIDMRAYWRSGLFAVIAAVSLANPSGRAGAQPAESAPQISDGVVKIGLILDLSGPYSETTGIATATAAKMAVEDFGGRVLGAPIEIVTGDHQNSANRAAAIARDWFDKQKVDAIMDVTGSSEALIVQAIAGGTRHKIISLSAPGAVRLTN